MRLDARFSHAQPMLGIQLAALVDGRHVHIRGGADRAPQADAASWWTTAYLQRFKLDPAYVIPDAELRDRYDRWRPAIFRGARR